MKKKYYINLGGYCCCHTSEDEIYVGTTDPKIMLEELKKFMVLNGGEIKHEKDRSYIPIKYEYSNKEEEYRDKFRSIMKKYGFERKKLYCVDFGD